MRNLMQYASECMQILDKIGIPYVTPISWEVNKRAKRWGRCERLPGLDGYEFAIQINASLLDERNDERGLKNTIIHELLHTCQDCYNHGYAWKVMAERVYRGTEYQYDIKRTSSAKEKGVKVDLRSERIDTHRYAVSCPTCGWVRYYERAGQHVQHPERYRCKACMTTIVRTK